MPELRFPEFKGPWKPARAGDAFRKSKAKGEAGLPIYSVTQDRGLVRRDSLERHMGADAADETNLRAQPGDLVYNMMRMWQGAVGMASEECMVSPAYVVLSPKKGVSSKFFDYWFQNRHMLHQLWAYSHGLTSDRLRLYYQDFAKIPLALPDQPEQEKIAAVLDATSRKITLLTDKKTTLEDYKRGLMQRLFSRELRFTRDDGSPFPDWEERKLGEFVTAFSGGTPTVGREAYYGGKIPFIKSAEISRDTTSEYLSELGLKKSAARLIEKGDLLVALYGANAGEVAFSKLDGAINQAVLCVRSELDLSFSFHFLGWKKNALRARYLQGGQGNFSGTIVKAISMPFPHPDEQHKIAAALSALDAKIDALSQKISEMEAFKKGLLQKLFV
ncbi:restriction endonuclease subunit S [Aliiroseovarius zhejiangensis]|uniref:restriction endonuclease subunit S n=1 Tax=Aliiroseovarius zhejiangensis TaxID=1632025 RepID=UPI00174A7BF1|nr:restriction endonuclease subunit S [Aliiroseovarius zhejiangensis]